MAVSLSKSDEAEIRALIGNHFEGMAWSPVTAPDWDRFCSDFRPEAVLYPSARPAVPKSVSAFVERMAHVAETVLHTFEEHTTGMIVHGFGNIAVAFAASEMLENGEEENRDVSGYLLIKCETGWKIAAHAWDKVTDEKPVPAELC